MHGNGTMTVPLLNDNNRPCECRGYTSAALTPRPPPDGSGSGDDVGLDLHVVVWEVVHSAQGRTLRRVGTGAMCATSLGNSMVIETNVVPASAVP